MAWYVWSMDSLNFCKYFRLPTVFVYDAVKITTLLEWQWQGRWTWKKIESYRVKQTPKWVLLRKSKLPPKADGSPINGHTQTCDSNCFKFTPKLPTWTQLFPKKTVGQNMLDKSKYALSSHFDWIVASPLVPLGQSPHFLWMKLIAAQSQPIGIVELSSLDLRSPTSLSMPSKSPWTSCPIIKYPHRFKAGIVHKSVYPNLNRPTWFFLLKKTRPRTYHTTINR